MMNHYLMNITPSLFAMVKPLAKGSPFVGGAA
jgi:hypothetical protein